MASTNEDTVTLTARCLCKANIFRTTIQISSLPLEAKACHCHYCRHSTGAICSIVADWPELRAKVDVSKLKVYAFGPSWDLLFCGTCSTPIFFANRTDETRELKVLTGTVENVKIEKDGKDVPLLQLESHIFVGDTVDGGATMWMRKINENGSEAKRYESRGEGENVKEYPSDWPDTATLTGYEGKKEDSIPVRCKCRGVDFVWNRPSYDGAAKEDSHWFIDPTTHKPVGGFCACDSCRLFSGVDVFNWSYTELRHLAFPSSKRSGASRTPFPKSKSELQALVDSKDLSIGTLTYYTSTPDVQRYFCSTCSACIFYAVDDRPEVLDVAIGLMEASDGARAEGFLSWAFGPIGNSDDSIGGWRHAMIKQMEKDSEEWRIKRNYPKSWRRVAREEAEARAKARDS